MDDHGLHSSLNNIPASSGSCAPANTYTQINAEDVDFQHKDHEQLQFEEKQGMYPPKFTIGILSLPEAKSTKVNFNFSGANRRIVMDIPLQMEGI